MLYKFIVWAFSVDTQYKFWGRYKLSPYNWRRLWEELNLNQKKSSSTFMMEEAGPHQVDANLHQAESRGSQHGNLHRSPKRREGHEGSVRTTHTTKIRSHVKSHVSYAKNDRNL